MKKLVLVLAVCLFVVSGCMSSSEKEAAAREKYGDTTLKVFNWGEYIGEDVIEDFEYEFGVKVIYETFDSNEAMYTKLQGGDQYDILIPSDYMIERLINEDMLQKLDKKLIPNKKYVSEKVLNLPYDPKNEYSYPYFWGSVGIVYNSKNISKKELEKQGFEIMKNKKYKGKIYVYDSERDAFMMAFKALGYSMNTENPKEIKKAYEWLIEMNQTMDPVYVTDEVIDNMAQGIKDLAVVYSGDAAYILNENPDVKFYMPKEGTNLWSDGMVIPKNAKNPKLAHEFINYMLDYEASYDNTVTVGYTTANKEVMEEMTNEGGEFSGNSAYIPRSNYKKDEVFKHNEVLVKKLADLWMKVKAN